MYHLLNTLQCLVESSLASCSLPAPSPPPSCQPSLPFSAALMGAIPAWVQSRPVYTIALHGIAAGLLPGLPVPLHCPHLHSVVPSNRCTDLSY